MKVKICGITNLSDALMAKELGADFVGVAIEIPGAKRSQTVAAAKPIFDNVSPTIALVLQPSVERLQDLTKTLNPYAFQLVGNESPEEVEKLKLETGLRLWKSFHLPRAGSHSVIASGVNTSPPIPLSTGVEMGIGGEVCDGEESLALLLQKANEYLAAGCEFLILDAASSKNKEKAYGGTGTVSDWELAREIVSALDGPAFLAGGINPNNVAEAIQNVQPAGIDSSSGVEAEFGKKDREKVKVLIEAARHRVIASEAKQSRPS